MTKDKIKKEELLKGIADKDTSVQIKAIKKCKKQGSKEVIRPLLELYVASNDEDVKNEIIGLLSELKDSASGDESLSFLLTNDDSLIKSNVLNSMWNSSLDYSEKTAPIVKIGLSGDFMTLFEAFTIIENLKGPFEEADIMDAMLYIKEYIHHGEHDEERLKLANDLIYILDHFSSTV